MIDIYEAKSNAELLYKSRENKMPRTSQMLITDEKAVYHVMSPTALDGFPLKEVAMLRLAQKYGADFIDQYIAVYLC